MPTIREIAKEYNVSHRVVEEFLELKLLEKPYEWNEENRKKLVKYLTILTEIKEWYFVFFKNNWHKTKSKTLYDSFTPEEYKRTWHQFYLIRNPNMTYRKKDLRKPEYYKDWVFKKYKDVRAQQYLDFYEFLNNLPEIEE